jgi:hypothetical protein
VHETPVERLHRRAAAIAVGWLCVNQYKTLERDRSRVRASPGSPDSPHFEKRRCPAIAARQTAYEADTA